MPPQAAIQLEELRQDRIDSSLLVLAPGPRNAVRLVGWNGRLCDVVAIKQQAISAMLKHAEMRCSLGVVPEMPLVIVHAVIFTIRRGNLLLKVGAA